MRRNARICASVASALVLSISFAACDFLGLSGPSGPGEIHANLVSFTPEGAAVFELTGSTGVDSIRSDYGDVYYQRDGGITRVVVIMNEPGLISFHMRVEDVGDLPDVTVLQVADGENELRTSLSDYEVEWVQVADSDLEMQRRSQ